MGTARTSSSAQMNEIKRPGCAPTPARSIFAPDTTKKTGVRKP